MEPPITRYIELSSLKLVSYVFPPLHLAAPGSKMYVCIYVCMYVRTYMLAYMCVMYVCVYIYVCVDI